MLTNARRITSASVIEGWTIESHLGPIFSHMVAGTDMFADMFAGFSDVFGGTSSAYRRELEQLRAAAIAELLKEAQSLGANWIVGFSIDFDEVSGRGKQMFMVTASGTAVFAKPSAVSANDSPAEGGKWSREMLITRIDALSLLDSIASGAHNQPDSAWTVAQADSTPEMLRAMLQVGWMRLRSRPEEESVTVSALADLARGISADTAAKILYRNLSSDDYAALCSKVIVASGLTTLSEVEAALDQSLTSRRWAIQTLVSPPRSMSGSDVPTLQRILANLAQPFPLAFQLTSSRSMLGKSKTEWRCDCGTSNAEEAARCGNCQTTAQGFKKGMVEPTKVIEILSRWLAVISGSAKTGRAGDA